MLHLASIASVWKFAERKTLRICVLKWPVVCGESLGVSYMAFGSDESLRISLSFTLKDSGGEL